MITVTSDLRIAFEQMGIKVRSLLDSHKAEIDAIVKQAIDNFDFERVLTEHVQDKIRQGLSDAMYDIDLTETLKQRIWAQIETSLNLPDGADNE
jgi:hypothetical protein